jgi:hypothetical protein
VTISNFFRKLFGLREKAPKPAPSARLLISDDAVTLEDLGSKRPRLDRHRYVVSGSRGR